MNTFYLQLLPSPESRTADDMPIGPRAYIFVKASSIVRCATPNGDCESTTISPECVSTAEVSSAIDTLIDELEAIRNDAGEFFNSPA